MAVLSTPVQVMLQLLLQLQWNYVAIVYDDDEYGGPAAEELRRLAEGRQLCIPVFASLPLDSRSSAFTTAANSVAQQVEACLSDCLFSCRILYIMVPQ